ncbi:hypothetical protein AYI68_g6635 [Smittium mucronatum]|uniref:Uncharacterized protein n=1 Tax=Smittium mucronatum TaxID=133383 RepID=A0A1R0GQZ2_9FUNG|nr:hypothetical protein AYI68_g6635 [Smittium mucronatum]
MAETGLIRKSRFKRYSYNQDFSKNCTVNAQRGISLHITEEKDSSVNKTSRETSFSDISLANKLDCVSKFKSKVIPCTEKKVDSKPIINEIYRRSTDLKKCGINEPQISKKNPFSNYSFSETTSKQESVGYMQRLFQKDKYYENTIKKGFKKIEDGLNSKSLAIHTASNLNIPISGPSMKNDRPSNPETKLNFQNTEKSKLIAINETNIRAPLSKLISKSFDFASENTPKYVSPFIQTLKPQVGEQNPNKTAFPSDYSEKTKQILQTLLENNQKKEKNNELVNNQSKILNTPKTHNIIRAFVDPLYSNTGSDDKESYSIHSEIKEFSKNQNPSSNLNKDNVNSGVVALDNTEEHHIASEKISSGIKSNYTLDRSYSSKDSSFPNISNPFKPNIPNTESVSVASTPIPDLLTKSLEAPLTLVQKTCIEAQPDLILVDKNQQKETSQLPRNPYIIAENNVSFCIQ